MNITGRWIASLLIFIILVLVLYGWIRSLPTSTPDYQNAQIKTLPAQTVFESPNPAYANAQATIDYGKSQLSDMSRKSTENSLNLSQAANAAVQSTQDFNRRQKMDLDYQATIISLNILQAAATQKFIAQQTKIAGDSASAAQSRAAAATQSAFLIHATQTAQAMAALTAYPLTATAEAQAQNVAETVQVQAILNAQAVQARQQAATLAAYPLTATPFAVTQAAILMQQYDREHQSFIKRVVTPLIPILAILDLLLLIYGMILTYRRLMLTPLTRRLRIGPVILNPGPMVMIDGVIVDHDPSLPRSIPADFTPSAIPEEVMVRVEIVEAAEPPFAHWIAEVEKQLETEAGGLP